MLTHDFTQELNRKLEEQNGTFWLPKPSDHDKTFEKVGFKFGETRDNTRLTTLPSGWKFKVDADYFADASQGISLVDEYGNRRVEILSFPYFESYIYADPDTSAMKLHPAPKNSLRKAKDLNEELAENGFCTIPKDVFHDFAAANHLLGEKHSFELIGFKFREIPKYNAYQMFLPFNWKFEAHFDNKMSEYTDITSYSVSIIDSNGLQRGLLHYNTLNTVAYCCLYTLMIGSSSFINCVKNNRGILFPLEVSNAAEFERAGFEIRDFDSRKDKVLFLSIYGCIRRGDGNGDADRYYVKLPAGWKLVHPAPLTKPATLNEIRLLLLDKNDFLQGICILDKTNRPKKIMLF